MCREAEAIQRRTDCGGVKASRSGSTARRVDPAGWNFQTDLLSNGSEFSSQAMDLWAYQHGVRMAFSRPGKPTDNAFVESFNGTFRAECLNAHWLTSLTQAQQIVETWRPNIMRAVLTGHSERRRRTSSPVRSRLAAISLGNKQPKTHPRVGTKKQGRSNSLYSPTHRGTKRPSVTL